MIRWADPDERASVLSLLEGGQVRCRQGNQRLVEGLIAVGWLVHGRRAGIRLLTEPGRARLESVADRQWPQWREALAWLRQRARPITATGLVEWERSRAWPDWRAEQLPARLNEKTLSALFARHSKSGLSAALAEQCRGVTVTHDLATRIRPNRGLALQRGSDRIEFDALCRVLATPSIGERDVLDGAAFAGVLPAAVFTIENLAAFIDLEKPDAALFVLAEGWNLEAALRVVALLPRDLPWWHFGDFDPAGLKIAAWLREAAGRPAQLLVPDCLAAWQATHGQPVKAGAPWPAEPGGDYAHPLIAQLIRSARWVEQECLVLDADCRDTIARLAAV